MLFRILLSMFIAVMITLGIILLDLIITKAGDGETWAGVLLGLFVLAILTCGVYAIIYSY